MNQAGQAGQIQMVQPVPFIRAATAADANPLPGAPGPVPGNFNRIGAGGLGATAPLAAFAAAPVANGVPLAFAAGGLNQGDYGRALEKVHYLRGYMTNSRDVGRQLADFRDFALQRLRQIVVRLQSIGQIAGAGAAAQTSLVQLIQDINNAGGPTRAQAQAMADLAAEMRRVDIPAEIEALVTEVNNLAQGLNAQADDPNAAPPTGIQGGVQADTGANAPPYNLGGGRRKRKKGKKTRRKKKKHKGGFKYSRIANSRRSLRMTRRKSLRHKKHHKKHNKKHKRTKKHRRRKRR